MSYEMRRRTKGKLLKHPVLRDLVHGLAKLQTVTDELQLLEYLSRAIQVVEIWHSCRKMGLLNFIQNLLLLLSDNLPLMTTWLAASRPR